MLLKKLINNLPSSIKNINIRNLALDSRKVKKGDLFFALKGSVLNGNLFIEEAIKKGARAVICSKNINIKNKKKNIPVIKVKNPRKYLTSACSKFFNKKPKNIIAVTGTNGKSSVADFFFQILTNCRVPVASIGTLGIKKKTKTKKTSLTSLDIISLHKELFELKKSRIDNVIIEASSHGLAQGRLNGINFKAGIFTNFSQDHLDYHKNMKNYFNSKTILFSKLLDKKKVFITDKEINGFSKLRKIAKKRKLLLKTIEKNPLVDLKKTSLIGKFQIKNLSMSILAAQACGLSIKKINPVIKKINSVNGRLELIRTLSNQAKVFVDYAHTPDALFTVLNSLKNHYKNKISLVFGCGGERDKKKRKIMAKIAKKVCNKIYVTDDNPRNENPKKIRKMITSELKKTNYKNIGNRSKAIKAAIENSEPSEIILVAGKGHEINQDYGKKIIKISDKSIIKKTIVKKLRFNKNKYNEYLNSKILNKIIGKNKNFKFKGVSINSKEIKKRNLFIAIKGKNNDGHNYIHEALKRGSKYCVVSKNIKNINRKKLIKFKNTNTFLNKLAYFKRDFSKANIIGVTGSSGKTTVKTLLGKMLKIFGKTYYSPKSFNNHFGVPLSLSNLEHEHDYGVFEIGMSKRGEIDTLSKLVRPDIGIITNIAQAHIENFRDIKGIAKAKSEIINNINENGILILNRDDKFYKYLKNIGKSKKLKILSFGISKKSDICLVKNEKIKNINFIKIQAADETLILKVKNNQNLSNILCCISVLKALNLDITKVQNFFENTHSLTGRGKIHQVSRYKIKFKLIDESYNANPLSVKNSIINLSNIKNSKSKKYILLGDMLELGKKSDFYHKNLSKIINNTNIDKLFVYGDKVIKTYKYTKKDKQGNVLQNIFDFDDVFSNIIKRNDYLMIKGSNATGLNKLSKNIIKGTTNVI